MPIQNFEGRLHRLGETLARLLAGEVDALDVYGEVEDDALGRIEETVQFLVMDNKTARVANRDKEASLLIQQEELERQQRLLLEQAEALATTAETIERQQAAIRRLSTPVLEVGEDVLVLPIIGPIDTQRGQAIMADLLENVVRRKTRWAIIDITGVESADTRTVDDLTKLVRAAGLLGTTCMISGIRPEVANTLALLDVDLKTVSTRRTLAEALETCRRRRGDP